MTVRSLLRQSVVPFALAIGACACVPASAATITWGTYSDVVTGSSAGSADIGFAGLGLSAVYSGELLNHFTDYPSYTPGGTFSGGTVSNAPPAANGIIQIAGGSGTRTDTITFSRAVVNPVLAIWSLGNGGSAAEFDFNQAFTIESGGSNAEYGGSTITAVGNKVFGNEGNGTIQFTGTFSSISWTTPSYEYWYGFTVGATAAAVTPVPEPETYALMLAGIAAVGFMSRRRRRAAD